MSQIARAWLLDWPVQALALALCEVIEIVEEPEVHRVPFGPAWCRALLYWRDRMLPLALSADAALEAHIVVVVAYQLAPREPLQYAAFAVANVPRQIEVDKTMDCELPDGLAFDEAALRACFQFETRTFIVPELSALFAPDATVV